MTQKHFSCLPVIHAPFVLGSCDRGAPTEPTEVVSSTFQSIQQAVFGQNCSTSGCHNSASNAGGLVLESGKSYKNLVNIGPTNTFARSAKHVLVKPNRPNSSFFFLKINQQLPPDFGGRMPLNSTTPLPANYRELIRQWIAAGAPLEGIVSDERLIADPIVHSDTLKPPDPPSQGIQLHVRTFAISPRSEREILVYGKIENGDSIFVNRFEIKMRPGSHHFLLYTYNGTDLNEGELRDLNPGSLGQEIFRPARQLFVGSQTPTYDFQLPANVVFLLVQSQGFDFNSHYVNSSSTVSTGEVFINLHTIEKNDSSRIALPVFDNYLAFFLPKTVNHGIVYMDKEFSVQRVHVKLAYAQTWRVIQDLPHRRARRRVIDL